MTGSAIVATSFGEEDSNNQFFAGVGICPGYDISKCMSRFTTPYKVSECSCCDPYDLCCRKKRTRNA